MASGHVPHPHIAARKEQGPIKLADQHPTDSRIGRFNARFAQIVTRAVGTMYCFYLFNLLASASAKSAFSSGSPTVIVNWVSSNWIQLILLPALMVGQNIQGRASDARAEQTYDDVELLLHELDQIRALLTGEAVAGSGSGESDDDHGSAGYVRRPEPAGSDGDPYSHGKAGAPKELEGYGEGPGPVA